MRFLRAWTQLDRSGRFHSLHYSIVVQLFINLHLQNVDAHGCIGYLVASFIAVNAVQG